MKVVEFLVGSVGNGAGMGWPTFGLIFGTLGLALGISPVGLILGLIAGGIFLLFSVPNAIFLSIKGIEERREAEKNFQEQEDKISQLIFDYLFSLLNDYLLQDKKNHTDRNILVGDIKNRNILVQTIKDKIRADIADINNNKYPEQVAKILDCLLDDKKSNDFLNNFLCQALNKQLDSNTISDFGNSFCREKKNLQPLKNVTNQSFVAKPNSFYNQLTAGYMGFAVGFGSIAGCGAGITGLLTSIGLFAGLAAVPIVGWAILGGALVTGIIVASICIYSANETDKKKQIIKNNGKVMQELTDIVNAQKTKSNILIEAQKKPQRNNDLNVMNTAEKKIDKRNQRSLSFSGYNKNSIWDRVTTTNQSSYANTQDPSLPSKHRR